jgi:hypothetical protein
MAIGVIWFPDVDKQTYDAVREKVVPSGKEKGVQFHAAGDSDGCWCIFELWESRDGLDRFMREDLAPAFDDLNLSEEQRPQPDHIFEVAFQGP